MAIAHALFARVRSRFSIIANNNIIMGAGTKNRFIIPVKVCYAGCSILSIDFHLDPHALLDIKFSRMYVHARGFCMQPLRPCSRIGGYPLGTS